MFQRGIRGAITLENDDAEALKDAVVTLLSEIKSRNKFSAEDISHVIFTLTDDIQCAYPAKFAREVFADWQYVPMMCVSELKINNSLRKCLRVLIVINTQLLQKEIKHVYLKGAEILRKDLK